MAKARIGIRYCGGCNPYYERVATVERVQSLAEGRFLFLEHDRQDLDGLIAVNGCMRACAAKALDGQPLSYHSISGENDLDSLMQWLFAFEQR